MKTRAVAILLVLLLSACANAATGPRNGGDSPSTAPDHPTGANDLVLRVDSCCGFTAFEYTLRQLPPFTLTGDGRVFTQGPQIEIYPGPALPNVQEQTITEDGIQAILDAARDAGLGESHDYIEPMTISDAPTTIFTLVDANGTRHVTRAYALTESNDDGIPPKDREARQKLRKFWDRLGDLQSWLPQGSVGDQHEYQPTALRINERTYVATDADPEQQPKDWPLQQPLSSFGEPVEGQQDMRCGTVDGSDAQTLLPDIKRSNELTPWVSDGTRYRLFVRPLLPDESGC
jgi:hypothetical protein